MLSCPYSLNLENEKSVRETKLENGNVGENPERGAEQRLLFWDFFSRSYIILGMKVYSPPKRDPLHSQSAMNSTLLKQRAFHEAAGRVCPLSG